MDIGELVGMDVLVGAAASSEGAAAFPPSLASSEPEHSKQRALFGSASLKRGRPNSSEEHDWRYTNVPRTEPMMLTSNSHSLFPDGEQMLSFSSSSTDAALSYYHLPSPSPSSAQYARNAGLASESSNVNMHGVLARVRGPFTPSQWMELEHQALIYKYIDANAPIPSSLLIPIRKSIGSSGFSAYSDGSFRSSALGWGSFHLGFSGNADPEPGRCRRTDGKKWRCSRDAVADGKYCERHMNRGRHRSRKHVEGQTGHAAKAMPMIVPSSAASAVSSSGSSNCFIVTQQQVKNLQPSPADPSPTQFNRPLLMSKENVGDHVRHSQGLSMLNSISSKPLESPFPMRKEHQHNPFEGTSSRADFGLISSDSLLNPQRKSYSEDISFASSQEFNDQQPHAHPLRHFIDERPKNQDRSNITWPDVDEMQTDRTQLSISIPVASSDFSSSSSSPTQEKLTLSPLKLSREFDPIHMGLGVGGVLDEGTQRQRSWIPISWEASVGGPLGEVLTNTNNTPKDSSKNHSSSSLNLLTDGWDSSPRLASSPTGVLQKTTFGSLSSSTGSSPRAEHLKTHDGTSSLCDDLLGSTLANASTIPSL